jgi:acyl carrier protein
MEDQEILTQITAIFNKVLKKQNVVLSAETTAADVDGWDSLTHMMIIDSIEKHFALRFKLMEIMKFNNVGDMISCIKKKINAQ